MKTRGNARILWLGAALALAACGQPKPAAEQAAASPPPAASTPASEPASPSLPRTPSPPGATVSIASPADGAVVSSPVKVVFAIEGMTVVPAGDATPDSGHHHLLVDAPLPADLGQPLPKDEQHLHFGKGQTDTDLVLPPGQHTLLLVLGDANHIPHDPPVVSQPVTITVQ